MLAVLALFCLASCPLTMGQLFRNNFNYPYAYQSYNGYNRQGFQRQLSVTPGFYSGSTGSSAGFQMLPEDDAAVNELGPDAVATGKKALNIASQLAKGVFPASGPIVNEAGAIQTKWGNYQLPNPQDREIVEKLLDATRDLLAKIPEV